MDKTYSPADIEQRWYAQWEASGAFAPRADEKAPPYCIMIPPPNVTGTLHMGHAFQDTIMDALTRYHRMRGEAALWQPGTDHAGIATQMLVERQLNAEGRQRTDLSREQFIERVWQWKRQSGGTIAQQLRRLGASVDWSRDRFTMDPGLSAAVTEVFVRLHEEQLIYRGQRLVNWDPVLRTALSDLEVLSEEESGSLWYLRYPLSDGSGARGRSNHPSRDHDRRCRGGRAPARRALPSAGGQDRTPPAQPVATSRSSPTSMWIRRSAPGASRSRPRTTSTITRSDCATRCR